MNLKETDKKTRVICDVQLAGLYVHQTPISIRYVTSFPHFLTGNYLIFHWLVKIYNFIWILQSIWQERSREKNSITPISYTVLLRALQIKKEVQELFGVNLPIYESALCFKLTHI